MAGLDAWDTNKYLNIWCGTFTGGDDGLLGIATFPFTTTEGPQGVVVSIATLPYASNVSRSYFPSDWKGRRLSMKQVIIFIYGTLSAMTRFAIIMTSELNRDGLCRTVRDLKATIHQKKKAARTTPFLAIQV